MKDNNEINKTDITQNNKKVEKDSDKKSKIKKKKSKSKIISNASNNNINIIIENEPIEKIQLKEEIRKNEKNLKKLNPLHFEFISNLSKSEMNFRVDNTFEVFNSILGQMCLVYAFKLENKCNSIATYNIIDYKTMGVLRNAHREDITNFRHYLDKRNRRDLILSVSATDNNVRMWDINNLEFIITINNINRHGFTKSACILNFNNDLFIVTSNYSHSEVQEPIRLYNMDGYKIKEINYKNNQTYFIDIYHDKQFDIKYIITGNLGFVRTYNYTNDCKYHRYNDDDDEEYEHYKVIIYNKDNNTKIISTGKERQIIIWDFHSTELINKIKVSDIPFDNLYGISLWNNNILVAGCGNTLHIIDIKNEEVVNILIGHSYNIMTIKTIIHPIYGECIVSQELYNGQIKLWANQINKMKSILNGLYRKLKFM